MNLIVSARRGIARMFGAKTKAAPTTLSGVDRFGRGTWHVLHDFLPGSWQQDEEIHIDKTLGNWAVFACITLIASDIGKLCLNLVEKMNGIWTEAASPSFSPVLRKPNRYQTRQQFIEQWIISKLTGGNTYVLKERDNRGVVVGLYVLDHRRVQPLVAVEDGSVYYQLQRDDLSQVHDSLPAVPASEIIHDRMNCLFHPLVGLSPIYACGLAAVQGLKIQQNSAKFFKNMSRPSGVLTAPGQISDETALRLKTEWEKNYSGDSIGKVAVLGDDLKYSAMTVNAVDAQLIEQLKMSAEMVCSTFHVPNFKVGVAEIPKGQKVEDLNQIYYSDCLQALMEAIETLLDEGLGLPQVTGHQYGTEFELDDLLKMDSATLTSVIAEQVKGGISKIDEARARLGMPPITGGDTAYLQQQNYSLAALAKRDSGADPFGTAKPPAPAAPAPAATDLAAAKALEGISAHFEENKVEFSKLADAVTELTSARASEQHKATGTSDEIIQLTEKILRAESCAQEVLDLVKRTSVETSAQLLAIREREEARAAETLAAEQKRALEEQAALAAEKDVNEFAQSLILSFTETADVA